MTAVRYVIITPVRDELEHIASTIQSVLAQRPRPAEWIIIDDGSTDGTWELLQSYASEVPWLRALARANRGFRNSETGAVEAFNDAYSRLERQDWEFLVNLDGDIELEPDYFSRCFSAFRSDSTLGIAGGTLYCRKDGAEVTETCPEFHVRGGTKIYRRDCWEQIGGIPVTPAWDSVDELKANMRGWATRTLSDARAHHRKPTGAADGPLKDAIKNGRSDYYCGYHPAFLIAKCIKRVFTPPCLIGAAGLAFGYFGSYSRREARVADRELIRYIRMQQVRKLLFQNSIWG